MSSLQIFEEADGVTPIFETNDSDAIAAKLEQIGVHFERWPTREAGADPLATYAPEIERLKATGGYRSFDVISLAPDHPDRGALRTKFLSEHVHTEDEVRFFVEGEGLFTLHINGRVFNILCRQGDLISVPGGTPHWFDMGPTPHFTAIRLFTNPDGWIAQFTGNAIAERFPRHEPLAA